MLLVSATLAVCTVPPFRYRDLGSIATIGRKRAIVWSVAHIYYLIVSAIVPSWR
jgi:NADH dehydrogenase FAD-containing subunit